MHFLFTIGCITLCITRRVWQQVTLYLSCFCGCVWLVNIREGGEEEEERFIFFRSRKIPAWPHWCFHLCFGFFVFLFLIYVMKQFFLQKYLRVASHCSLPRFRYFESKRKRAGSSSRPGSVEGRHLPVAVCFNSVNVLYGDGSIKLLHLDTL